MEVIIPGWRTTSRSIEDSSYALCESKTTNMGSYMACYLGCFTAGDTPGVRRRSLWTIESSFPRVLSFFSFRTQ